MFNQIELGLLKDFAITQVSCGDDKLRKIVSDNFDTIFLTEKSAHTGCNKALLMLYIQKALLNTAIAYSRNQVDVSKTRGKREATGKATDDLRATGYSQRTQVAQGCAWSTATSFRQFQRDSEGHDRAFSDSEAKSTLTAFSRMSDRSRSWSSGFANTFESSRGTVDGDGFGYNNSESKRTAISKSGTGGSPPALNIDPGGASGLSVTNTIEVHYPTVSFSSGITWPPQWVTGSVTLNDPGAASGFSNPGATGAACFYDPESGLFCPDIPSYSGGYNVKYSLSVGVPGIGVLRVSWGSGENFSQTFVCGGGKTTTEAESLNHIEYDETAVANSRATSLSHDENHKRNDKHSTAESHSRASSKTDAAASGISRARGESHSGSDRTAHNQREGNGQSSASSDMTREFRSKSDNASKTVSDSRYWSQMFDALEQMWEKVMEDIQNTHLRLSAKYGATIDKMSTNNPEIPYSEMFNQIIRNSGNPAYGGCLAR